MEELILQLASAGLGASAERENLVAIRRCAGNMGRSSDNRRSSWQWHRGLGDAGQACAKCEELSGWFEDVLDWMI